MKDQFVDSSVDAVAIDGRVWGIPTEINNYMLLYNKRLLGQAGYSEPPATWEELVQMAVDTTERNEQGKIVQAGYAFMQGWDSAVVHPFLALLFGEGGQMFSDDMTEAAFNSPAGVRALEKELALFDAGATSPNVSVWDFPTGMIVTLGAIPSNQADAAGHLEELGDAFSEPFVDALDYSISEPNVMQGQEIKVILMNYILEAWHGNMSAQEALDAAAQEVDNILWEFY